MAEYVGLQFAIERGAETPALIVVGETIEQVGAQLLEVLRRHWCRMDRVGTLRAIEGVRIVEQRILPRCDEVVQLAFDSRVVGDLLLARGPGIRRRRRRYPLGRRPASPMISRCLPSRRRVLRVEARRRLNRCTSCGR